LLVFYAQGFRCCCKEGALSMLLDVVVVTTALVWEVLYLATGPTQVLFVLVLRIIRILNGLVQQYLRNKGA
jgi:prepilin signal peptidase PulO-like enzyme (type II secretory pathway)